MSKILNRLLGVFRRGHPDIYDAVKKYAEKRGVTVSDVIAAATSAYLQTDAEGKEELEKALASRRTSAKGASNLKESIGAVTELLKSLGDVFSALNEVRSTVSIQSVVSDYKTLREAVRGVAEEGQASGKGTIDDYLAQLFVNAVISKFTGGAGGVPLTQKPPGKNLKKTGKGKVIEVEE